MPHTSKGCWLLISAASSVGRKRQKKESSNEGTSLYSDYIKQFNTIYTVIYRSEYLLLRKFIHLFD